MHDRLELLDVQHRQKVEGALWSQHWEREVWSNKPIPIIIIIIINMFVS